jgi:hypothetical protein
MLALVSELLRNLNLQKKRGGLELARGMRLLMLSRLLQILAIAGTIERHLALLAATLRANTSMDRGTEAFLFSNSADRAAQIVFPFFSISIIASRAARYMRD